MSIDKRGVRGNRLSYRLGLWGYPTVINNVETPQPADNRKRWMVSPDRHLTSLHLAVRTLCAMGTTPRTRVLTSAAGEACSRWHKPAGPRGCLPALLNPPNLCPRESDCRDLAPVDDSPHRDVVKSFMHFFEHESCGKCTPCREGTYRLARLVEKIEDEEATLADLDVLSRLCRVMERSCLCGLGQAAPKPVLTTLKYFKEEYLVHLRDQAASKGA